MSAACVRAFVLTLGVPCTQFAGPKTYDPTLAQQARVRSTGLMHPRGCHACVHNMLTVGTICAAAPMW